MSILVHSARRDLHAAAVCWGLARLGEPYLFWPAGEFPRSQALSASFSAREDRHLITIDGSRHDLSGIRTVWNRRRGRPALRPDLDARDAQYALDQSRQHLASFLGTMCPSAFWVNRPDIAGAELEKMSQLRLAGQVGLTVPATLFSNDPHEIRGFFEREDGDIVHKAYKLRAWTHEEKAGVFVNYTTRLAEAHLRDDDVLSAAPGIFQRRVDKAFEVRVTIFGREAIGARLDGADEATDWRAQPRDQLRVSKVTLPEELRTSCFEYMRLGGLNFCCFDFIVTPSGDYVFLEANQMGQFLWIEEKVPELPMLDIMCAFLASADPDFRWGGGAARLSFAEFLDSPSSGAEGVPAP